MNESDERNGQGNEDSEPVDNFRTSPPPPPPPSIQTTAEDYPGTGTKRGKIISESHFSSLPSSSPPSSPPPQPPVPRGSNKDLDEELQESSSEKDCPPPPTTTAAHHQYPPKNNAPPFDLSPPPIIVHKLGSSTRIRKKSEEGKRIHLEGGGSGSGGKRPGKNRIPVGIAVAWQRHVTSTSHSTPHTTTSSYASTKHHHHHRPTMSSPPPKTTTKRSRPASPARSTSPVPTHLSSVPEDRATLGGVCLKLLDAENGLNNNNNNNSALSSKKRNGGVGGGREVPDDAECGRSEDGGRDRLTATSMTHHNNTGNSSFFSSAYGFNNPYGDWTSQYLVPNSSQQSYNAMVAAYMQQLSMHPQLQYGYNNLPAAYLYGNGGGGGGGYSAEQLHQYEQLLLHQQEQQQQYEQRRLDYAAAGATNGLRPRPTSAASLPALSPRISIPSPSPNSPHGPYPAHQASSSSSSSSVGMSPWSSSDLYHHHHPMTLSSSATLSPRSLASSTPSPITTYESLNQSYLYGSGRKCVTPNPSPLKQQSWPLLASPFSPTILPAGKDPWKETGPVSLVTHGRKPGPVSPVAEEEIIEDGATEEDDEIVDSMVIPRRSQEEESILVKPEKKSVDYSRLESLIEKRGEASVRLLAHTPSPPPPPPPEGVKKKKVTGGNNNKNTNNVSSRNGKGKSSGGDKGTPGQSSKKKAAAGKERKRRRFDADHRRLDCDGNEMQVPDEESSIRNSCVEAPRVAPTPNNNQSHPLKSSIRDRKSQTKRLENAAKYFCPIGTVEAGENLVYQLEDGEVERKRCKMIGGRGRGEMLVEGKSTKVQGEPGPTPPAAAPGHDPIDTPPTTKVTSSLLPNNVDCDSESDGASWPFRKASSSVGAKSSKDKDDEKHCSSYPSYPHSSLPTFPTKIVIPSGESSLNLLATVAQEIGPYISMLPNNPACSTSPRRFENLEQLIRIERSEVCEEVSPTTTTTTPSITPRAQITNGNSTELVPSIIGAGDAGEGNTHEAASPPSESPRPTLNLPLFQLKIPQIIPRVLEKKSKKNSHGGRNSRKEKGQGQETPAVLNRKDKVDQDGLKTSGGGRKHKRIKEVKGRGEVRASIKKEEVSPVKSATAGKQRSNMLQIDRDVEHEESKKKSLISSSMRPLSKVNLSKVNLLSMQQEQDPKPLDSIYDFEVDDVRPSELESFKHFTTGGEKPVKSEGKGTKLSSLSPKTKSWSPTIKSKESQKIGGGSPEKKRQSPVPKSRAADPSGRKRMTSDHPPEKPKRKSDFGKSEDGGRKKTENGLSTTSLLRPSAMDSLVSASLNTDSNTSFVSNESSSSAWTANPIHAVRAVIKTEPLITNGNGGGVKKLGKKKSVAATTATATKVKSEEDSGLSEELRRMRVSSSSSSPSGGQISTKSVKSLFTSPTRKKEHHHHHHHHHHHIKPCLKAEPIRIKSPPEESEDEDLLLDLGGPTGEDDGVFLGGSNGIPGGGVAGIGDENKSTEPLRIRKPSIDMNIFSRRVKSIEEEKEEKKESVKNGGVGGEWDQNVVIGGVEEMIDEMRVLTEIHGLFYTGKLNAIHPPDVYGVTLDNERGNPPHIIFPAEEVLERCIRERKPWEPPQLPHGLRICAYWSPMYSGLYPGRVSTDYDLKSDLVPVEFDDGDTGVIKICEIRLLASNHPVREYDPNPLLTLEKKHRKRHHSSAAGSQNGCTGDHEEDDCGEPYCAKIAKLEEAENENEEEEFSPSSSILKYWTWSGVKLGGKLSNTKQNRHKEFYQGIQRGDEVINVGDSAIFISDQRNRRPFLGRVEKFWEKKGLKSVTVRWFYHPEEAKLGKKSTSLKSLNYPGALFESPHIDDNDVQTIAKKCEVLPFQEFKEKYGSLFTSSTAKSGKSHKALKGVYYVAGHYDPCSHALKMKDLK